MYNEIQKKIIAHARERVRILFKNNPFPGHNFDHILRVRNLAVIIAKKEKADVYLSELSAWLHDIGRVKEKHGGPCHHILSYEMCRKWFREDAVFKKLAKKEKLIVLYAVRNHWNDQANKYPVAWILRDADKIDGYGRAGVRRIRQYTGDKGVGHFNLHLCIYTMGYLKTATAKRIVREKNLFLPIKKWNDRMLKRQVVLPKL